MGERVSPASGDKRAATIRTCTDLAGFAQAHEAAIAAAAAAEAAAAGARLGGGGAGGGRGLCVGCGETASAESFESRAQRKLRLKGPSGDETIEALFL